MENLHLSCPKGYIDDKFFSPCKEKEAARGFTLVELIVVITILAILGTIAFISMQGYSAQSRDSVRISDIGNLAKALELSMLKGEKVPMPENKIDITASGILIAYQGEAGQKTLNVLGMSNGGKDPLEETYYTYTTNKNLTKYQVMGFLEEGTEISYDLGLNKLAEAKDLSKRQVYIKGDELGLLLDSTTSEPVNRLGANIDISQPTNQYKAVFTTTDVVTGSGTKIFSNYYNRNKELLTNKDLAKLDDSLVLYMDMETTTMSGSKVVLKDLSKYGNNGYCYNSGVLVDCGSVSGPQFVDDGMYFNGIDRQWVEILDNESMEYGNHGTIIIKYNIKGLSGLANSSTDYAKFLTKDDILDVCSTTYAFNLHTTLLSNSSYTGSNLQFVDYLDIDNCDGQIFSFGPKISYSNDYTASYVFNDLNTSVYLEGNKIYENNEVNFLLKNTIDNWKIGAGHTYYLNGMIDEVRIYNRVLSDDEVKILYEAIK